jgi:hypothetical protein
VKEGSSEKIQKLFVKGTATVFVLVIALFCLEIAFSVIGATLGRISVVPAIFSAIAGLLAGRIVYCWHSDFKHFQRNGWDWTEPASYNGVAWGDEAAQTAMHSRTQMLFGYPLGALGAGGISLACFLQAFGLVDFTLLMDR